MVRLRRKALGQGYQITQTKNSTGGTPSQTKGCLNTSTQHTGDSTPKQRAVSIQAHNTGGTPLQTKGGINTSTQHRGDSTPKQRAVSIPAHSTGGTPFQTKGGLNTSTQHRGDSIPNKGRSQYQHTAQGGLHPKQRAVSIPAHSTGGTPSQTKGCLNTSTQHSTTQGGLHPKQRAVAIQGHNTAQHGGDSTPNKGYLIKWR